MSDEIESKERHTPGPWEIRYEGRDHEPGFGIASKSDKEMVCEAWFPGRGPSWSDRMKADARLIAAAPDMHAEIQRLRAVNAELLAALQGLMADDYRNATAALANELETEAEGALIEEREAAARAAISQATEAKGPA